MKFIYFCDLSWTCEIPTCIVELCETLNIWLRLDLLFNLKSENLYIKCFWVTRTLGLHYLGREEKLDCLVKQIFRSNIDH